MTIIGHDRKYQSEQRANQPQLDVLQSGADRVAAFGCLVVLTVVVVVVVVWPGLVMH